MCSAIDGKGKQTNLKLTIEECELGEQFPNEDEEMSSDFDAIGIRETKNLKGLFDRATEMLTRHYKTQNRDLDPESLKKRASSDMQKKDLLAIKAELYVYQKFKPVIIIIAQGKTMILYEH